MTSDILEQLKAIVWQSRTWVTSEHGRVLLAHVSKLLREIFLIEAGMFVLIEHVHPEREQFMPEVYETWGVSHTLPQLSSLLKDESWWADVEYTITEDWLPVSEAPSIWQHVLQNENIQDIGVWKLTAYGKLNGVMVLGRRETSGSSDREMMSVCAAHVSLVLEVIRDLGIAKHASTHDALTGLLNRRGFDEEIVDLRQRHEHSLVIGILDVDQLKLINDVCGHLQGDLVLIEVAKTLKAKVGEHGIVARFGGDEFVLAFQTQHSQFDVVAKQVASWFSDKKYTVTVGCAVLANQDKGWEPYVALADQRLYMERQRKRDS